MADQRGDELRAAEKRIEVAPGTPSGERVVARIDVVGPDLEALNGRAVGTQRADQSARDRRLACARARAGDDDARDHAATARSVSRPPEARMAGPVRHGTGAPSCLPVAGSQPWSGHTRSVPPTARTALASCPSSSAS